jgi:hypothetical protein
MREYAPPHEREKRAQLEKEATRILRRADRKTRSRRAPKVIDPPTTRG